MHYPRDIDTMAHCKTKKVFHAPLVSVIIPSYNHGEYLACAVESVFNQTHAQVETIVVDDGSTDNTAVVARSSDQVRLIQQQNLGLAAARNAGLRASRGEFVVFLDADDLLRRNAIERGVGFFSERPECAFVCGHYGLVDAAGLPIPFQQSECPGTGSYETLLSRNHIGMHAAVMYNRGAVESVGGFDTSLRACEDYDLYLRMASRYPFACHHTVIADYRQHPSNMSNDSTLMLRSSLKVLRRQKQRAKRNPRHLSAYRAGIDHWKEYWAKRLIRQAQLALRRRERLSAARNILSLIRHNPVYLGRRSFNRVQRLIARGSGALFTRSDRRQA